MGTHYILNKENHVMQCVKSTHDLRYTRKINILKMTVLVQIDKAY
jgi:hypothetical protein